LKERLVSSTVLTEEQASKITGEITSYFKEKSPSVFHKRIDDMVAGKTLENSFMDELDEIGKNVRERANDPATDLKSAFDKAFKNKEQ
jgi:hypothetical protein